MSVPFYVRKRQLFAYISLLPTLVIFGLFIFVPLVQAFMVSLSSGLGVNQRFIGFRIYKSIIVSFEFWNSLRVTFLFCGGFVTISAVLGLMLAVLVNRRVKFRNFFRSCMFFPYMVSMVVIALIWQYMLNERFGIINYFLNLVGLQGLPWLKNPSLALLSVIGIQVWTLTGYNMMLLLGGLQAIPDSYYDASKIDGATAWQRLLHVTVPLLLPTLLLAILISLVYGFTQSFVLIQVITHGGPHYATDVLPYLIYRTAFDYFDLARANAFALIGLAILMAIGIIQYRFEARFKA